MCCGAMLLAQGAFAAPSSVVEKAMAKRGGATLALSATRLNQPGLVGVSVRLEQPRKALRPALGEVFVDFDSRRMMFEGAAAGDSAVLAERFVRCMKVDADTIRCAIVGYAPTRMASGELVRLRFRTIGLGPAFFRFDVDATTLSPKTARAGMTFGVGRPDLPLVVKP